MRRTFSVAGALSLVLAATPHALAADYQCTPVVDAQGQPVSPPISQAWAQRCIPYAINRNNDLFSGESRRLLIRQSFDVWQNNPCSDIDFVDLGYTNDTPGFDPARTNRNIVTAAETAEEVALNFGDNVTVAVTVTAFSRETGEIFDADIVVNDVQFDFADVTDDTACLSTTPPPYDLRTILVHEMGHLIGFDHSADPESTMYFEAGACETKKRTLTDDDILGLCTVYASGQPTRTCAPPPIDYDELDGVAPFRNQCARRLASGGGCRCDAPFGTGGWLTLLLGALPLARRRRR